ncbi:MAG TPA: hypothetical protein VKE96_07180 [Vicinamibacterales bacterium]|nr:hypothetical protein [Vicinamibacterales bacterium]
MHRFAGATLIALCLSSSTQATTVVAPSFEQLVSQADIVFEGEVIDTRARIGAARDGSPIVTDVYFRVARPLKGAPAPTLVLQFLGGEIDDRRLTVDGMPRFVRGDRDVIFAVTSTTRISPLVGLMHGRVRITAEGDGKQDTVRLFDGTPLRAVDALGATRRQPLLAARPAMSLAAFESAIVSEVARQDAARARPR